MRIVVTGGAGYVGRFVVEAALSAGHEVAMWGRTAPAAGAFTAPVAFQPFELGGPVPDLGRADALVHAAFSHAPGRYRGGEGDDPAGFVARNRDGSLRLFEAARAAGVGRLVFLSSRAVYGAYPPGTTLTEDLPPRPDTLYGEVKHAVEDALAALDGTSLRATGVYGPAAPGAAHKWTELFAAFRRGEAIAPRIGTEVHGDDLGAAVLRLLEAPEAAVAGRVFNCSDIVLDRRELLALAAELGAGAGPLPAASDPARVSAMATDRLKVLGWRPGGRARLRAALPGLVAGS